MIDMQAMMFREADDPARVWGSYLGNLLVCNLHQEGRVVVGNGTILVDEMNLSLEALVISQKLLIVGFGYLPNIFEEC
jgi:hypothetical protein